jgi:hypothetical protein
MNLAFNANCPYVMPDRWIASLSDGTTVFEDRIPGNQSAWNRLKTYLKVTGLHVTRLRLQAYDKLVQLPPLKAENSIRQLDGYWQARAVTKFNTGLEFYEHGIGFIRDKKIFIQWIRSLDGAILEEVRDYDPNKDLAAIMYE